MMQSAQKRLRRQRKPSPKMKVKDKASLKRKKDRFFVAEVCDDLIYASWLTSVSPKAKQEIEEAVAKLERHFRVKQLSKCPMCGQPNDNEIHKIITCSRCHKRGSTACCIPLIPDQENVCVKCEDEEYERAKELGEG